MEIIKNSREFHGYSQEKMANLLGIAKSSYIDIEKDRHTPNVITALKLCILLDLNPFEIWKDRLSD